MDLINREEKIAIYLRPQTGRFIFDELSAAYLEKAGMSDILSGVPVPIRKDQLSDISVLTIARSMAFIIGCDPRFKYRDNYIAYIMRAFDARFAQGLIADGVEAAQREDFLYACVQFRAAQLIDPQNIDAVYCYGRVCKDLYERGEDEEYIARFKAESLEAFEEVTMRRPDFADAYYFLGYGYINLGLYVKAKLTWEEFLRLSTNEEKKQEIAGRLAQLADPVRIEQGYNMIISGRMQEGIEILEAFTESQYSDWWPLWYYLGVAYQEIGQSERAREAFIKVLRLSPSNTETMEELVHLYEEEGNSEKAEKYRRKIALIGENREQDRLLAAENRQCSHLPETENRRHSHLPGAENKKLS